MLCLEGAVPVVENHPAYLIMSLGKESDSSSDNMDFTDATTRSECLFNFSNCMFLPAAGYH
jgi:hypothetical protein